MSWCGVVWISDCMRPKVVGGQLVIRMGESDGVCWLEEECCGRWDAIRTGTLCNGCQWVDASGKAGVSWVSWVPWVLLVVKPTLCSLDRGSEVVGPAQVVVMGVTVLTALTVLTVLTMPMMSMLFFTRPR